jgi:hypothetical protein
MCKLYDYIVSKEERSDYSDSWLKRFQVKGQPLVERSRGLHVNGWMKASPGLMV